ncbi:MAG: 3-oxoacyl-[acyl-carrier-protein] reductase [Pseudomonadota bacterium]
MISASRKTIVVTGGSRGIGRALCAALAAPDVDLYFNYSSAEADARTTAEMVRERGAAATALQMDVTDPDQVVGFFQRIVEDTGRIDVLVNNAGITRDGLLVRMKDAQWDVVMDTNLKGAFRCTRAAAKQMLKQRSGRIIQISSVVGATGNPGQANYVASKAGIIGFTKAVALELASRGITVNAVAPGFIDTDMTASLPEKSRQAMIERIPLGRVGTPEDVAAAVVFLASAQAAYITGQVIHVSGGMTM